MLEPETDLETVDPAKLRKAARLMLLKDNQVRDEAQRRQEGHLSQLTVLDSGQVPDIEQEADTSC
jgi:hypothetical protein